LRSRLSGSPNDERSALISTLIVTTTIQVIVFALVLFVPAVGTITASIGILNVDEQLRAERFKPPIQKEQSAPTRCSFRR